MPNTRTARKAMRQSRRRTMINKARKSRVRTFVRKVERAIAAGDADA
ncbi:MAG TPA: 30S ribosomal protein S20, partial [Thermopetrobacter sp.]|nr:30S ribosomal protein S20 [Thermopetrobacter sp.]